MKPLEKVRRWLGRQQDKKLYAQSLGEVKLSESEGTSLVSYFKNGKLDYNTYRSIQQAGNMRKIDLVSAEKNMLKQLATFLTARLHISSVLCHGTRNGTEQKWFREFIPSAKVLGTEISDTAPQFPDTIQWDFHDTKPEWQKAFDVVYSNSWDHTYDPEKLFSSWASCVSSHGFLALEHTDGHLPEKRAPLDPFGATREGLIRFIEGRTALRKTEILEAEDGRKNRSIILFSAEA
jgi:hypothetical protein